MVYYAAFGGYGAEQMAVLPAHKTSIPQISLRWLRPLFGSAAFWGGLQADIRITKVRHFRHLQTSVTAARDFPMQWATVTGLPIRWRILPINSSLIMECLGLLLVKKFAFGQEYDELPHNSFCRYRPGSFLFLSGKSTSMSFFGSSMPAVSGSNSAWKWAIPRHL